MTYRDDHEAALERIAALEVERAQLRIEIRKLRTERDIQAIRIDQLERAPPPSIDPVVPDEPSSFRDNPALIVGVSLIAMLLLAIAISR